MTKNKALLLKLSSETYEKSKAAADMLEMPYMHFVRRCIVREVIGLESVEKRTVANCLEEIARLEQCIRELQTMFERVATLERALLRIAAK